MRTVSKKACDILQTLKESIHDEKLSQDDINFLIDEIEILWITIESNTTTPEEIDYEDTGDASYVDGSR